MVNSKSQNNVKMPIHFISMRGNINCGAVWTYNPNEELDLSGFSEITTLHIKVSRPVSANTSVSGLEPEPYVVPSLSRLFPRLITLRIGGGELDNTFIGGITDIPVTVTDLIIHRSYITDLATLLLSGINLVSITILTNLTPNTFSVPLPFGVSVFYIYNTIVKDAIIFPRTIACVYGKSCTLPRIYGFDRNLSVSVYISIINCITPYNKSYLISNNIPRIVAHITRVNAQQVYLELGSIPKRIRVSTDKDLENPIIIAMNLASNYPRRMAEFVVDL